MVKKDGGLAFPGSRFETDDDGQFAHIPMRKEYAGLSLREYFAGQALIGLLAACKAEGEWRGFIPYTAKKAYELADAMIAEREKE